ncbi:MAG: glycosyltransferase, partial [Myxococcota bacterium]
MRIVYLSQYYPPEPGAPAARVSELARRWVERGHEVTVLTGFPHHPTGVVPSQYRGRLQARESENGVEILRSYVYATPNSGKVRRSLTYASYAASSVLAGPLAASVRRADVI